MEERAREKGNICLICTYCGQHHAWFFGNIHLFNFQTKIWGEVKLSLLCVCAKLLQLCPTLCDPMDCSPPGSSVHGILQARILEWVALEGIFLTQGSNSCLLHWQAGSLPLAPPRKPTNCVNRKSKGLDCSQASTEWPRMGFSIQALLPSVVGTFPPPAPTQHTHKMHCLLQISPPPPLSDHSHLHHDCSRTAVPAS